MITQEVRVEEALPSAPALWGRGRFSARRGRGRRRRRRLGGRVGVGAHDGMPGGVPELSWVESRPCRCCAPSATSVLQHDSDLTTKADVVAKPCNIFLGCSVEKRTSSKLWGGNHPRRSPDHMRQLSCLAASGVDARPWVGCRRLRPRRQVVLAPRLGGVRPAAFPVVRGPL